MILYRDYAVVIIIVVDDDGVAAVAAIAVAVVAIDVAIPSWALPSDLPRRGDGGAGEGRRRRRYRCLLIWRCRHDAAGTGGFPSSIILSLSCSFM